ncbi:MAG: hypothetical protein GY861_01060 [bacterium]|nr:hypothetical protein [bacterium]
MAKTVTLTTLRTKVRNRTDTNNDPNIEDTYLDDFLNQGLAELRDKLYRAFGETYLRQRTTISLVSGQAEYDLDTLITTFYILDGVDMLDTGTGSATTDVWFPMDRWDDNDRTGVISYNKYSVRYQLEDKKLILDYPPDNSTDKMRVVWRPYHSDLSTGSDTVDGYNGYEDYAVLYASILVKDRQESDSTVLQSLFAKLAGELDEKAAMRDRANPEKIVDTAGYFETTVSRQAWDNLLKRRK